MRTTLSNYKLKKISIEAYKNGLRLHFDSILLFRSQSYPSAFQLSVLALEEFSKSYSVEHYYYSKKINRNPADSQFEQQWLNLLYLHPRKQKAFFGWGLAFDYKNSFIEMIERGELEMQKQKATYVGLHKRRRIIDINGRISLPTQISGPSAKKMISLLNDYLIDQHEMKNFHGFHFDVPEKDALLTSALYQQLKEWKHKSGLRKVPNFGSRLRQRHK